MTTTQLHVGAGGLDAVRAVMRLPRIPTWAAPEQRLQLVEEEAALRDDLVAYGYAYDAGDVDALLAHFADAVVITNPRARYAGSDPIRKNYAFLFQQCPRARRIWANAPIRFPRRDAADPACD